MIHDTTPQDNSLFLQPRGPTMPKRGWMWFEHEFIDVFMARIGGTATAVYVALARYADIKTQTCWPSVERMARELGSTPEIIMEGLRTLANQGMITMQVRHRGHRQYPSYLFTLLSLKELAASLPSEPAPPASITPYSQKLRDPRWQKKRLEVFTLDHWQCQNCGDTTTTLQVHHHMYQPGLNPWDYPLETLATLCEPCHEAITQANKRLGQGGQS
jgi:Helix-turn-helix domain